MSDLDLSRLYHENDVTLAAAAEYRDSRRSATSIVTVDRLLEAEATLEGEALVAVQIEYLRTSDRWFPGEMHDEDECVVCDSRRVAIRRHDEEPGVE